MLESNSTTTSQLRVEHLRRTERDISVDDTKQREREREREQLEEEEKHRLFQEVLTLLSGQENFGSFGQSADQSHLLTTVPQLQRFSPTCGEQGFYRAMQC